MSRDYRLYLADIIQSCDLIQEYTTGVSFEVFSASQLTIDAVARNLEIIGEAVKNIPPDVLAMQPEIAWKDVARFRDVIAHYYFRVKLNVVWRILKEDLDDLRSAASKIYHELPQESE